MYCATNTSFTSQSSPILKLDYLQLECYTFLEENKYLLLINKNDIKEETCIWNICFHFQFLFHCSFLFTFFYRLKSEIILQDSLGGNSRTVMIG